MHTRDDKESLRDISIWILRFPSSHLHAHTDRSSSEQETTGDLRPTLYLFADPGCPALSTLAVFPSCYLSIPSAVARSKTNTALRKTRTSKLQNFSNFPTRPAEEWHMASGDSGRGDDRLQVMEVGVESVDCKTSPLR